MYTVKVKQSHIKELVVYQLTTQRMFSYK